MHELFRVLNYEAASGNFYWMVDRRTARKGDVAGERHSRGYIAIRHKRKFYLAHRMAWFFTHGQWPMKQIDHINGIRTDNRICNLREANQSENTSNGKLRTTNNSGFKGVSFGRATGKWRATITKNCKQIHLGWYDSAEEAATAYRRAAITVHGEFARIE